MLGATTVQENRIALDPYEGIILTNQPPGSGSMHSSSDGRIRRLGPIPPAAPWGASQPLAPGQTLAVREPGDVKQQLLCALLEVRV